MEADRLLSGVFLVFSAIFSFYVGRRLLLMSWEKPGFAYLIGTLLLTILAFAVLMITPPFFFLFLALFLIFRLMVAKRVLMTGRIIRGRLACIAWFAGGVVLHLARWNDDLYRLPLPHWLLAPGFALLVTGFLFASLQLRDAETYFT